MLPRRDADYGTAGTLIVPGTRLGISNDKDGGVYVINLDKMGGFQARVLILHWVPGHPVHVA